MTTLFVAKESRDGETRCAATPETVGRYIKRGFKVLVQTGAGEAASYRDSDFSDSGAEIISDFASGCSQSDVVLKVARATVEEAGLMKKGSLLVSFLQAAQDPGSAKAVLDAGVSNFAMELVPRTTLAQKMDALSSQANIAGYKAVLIAACELGRYFPLLMTAAGTVKPARVVIFGVGVAGLQAIATAKRLGAIVEATDIRPEVKEQVESLGGKFIEVKPDDGGEDASVYAKEASDDYKKRQAEAVGASVAQADVVITTAQVPGAKAPVLVPEAMVKTMKFGAVIVDLAVEQGGNCDISEAGKIVVKHGVKLVGTTNLPGTVAVHASQLYARNVQHVVDHLVPTKENDNLEIRLDFEDEIIGASIAIHGGEVRHQPTATALQLATA
ncbi:MAG: Re/Si-specific NAD(P)(+) transhydrogenase subunit alpha [Planctomycetota bacterium]|nr:Re/Si-specific NAD(P)(+) transhydrogenase subunit alpha [Planctomycetota bacterium]